MNLSAESAREAARRANGQFGEQPKADPGAILDATCLAPFMVGVGHTRLGELRFDASHLLAGMSERDWDGMMDGSYDVVAEAVDAGLLQPEVADGPSFVVWSDDELEQWYQKHRIMIDPAVPADPPEYGTWRHQLWAGKFAGMLAEQLGGDVVNTGGGCTAVEVPLPDDRHMLITDGNASQPDGGEDAYFGAYNVDGEPLDGPDGELCEWLDEGPYSVNDLAVHARQLAEKAARL